MQDLNLCLIQTELHWQNPAKNREQFTALITDHAPEADLIVLPEMFTTGFTMDAADHAESMQGDTLKWLQEIAAQNAVTVCGSLIISENDNFYNRLVWMRPDGSHTTYDKRHLFRMANEQDTYTAGTRREIVQIGDWRICPLICYDLRFPVWSRGLNEFDLLLYTANWPAPRRSAWQTLLPARAVENQCYCAGVGRIGTDGNNVNYVGDSMVADYLGHTQLDCEDKSGAFTTQLSLEKLNRYRKKFPAYLDGDSFELKS